MKQTCTANSEGPSHAGIGRDGSAPRESRRGGGETEVRLRGLCANCGLRDVCLYPKSPVGVLCCDEYE